MMGRVRPIALLVVAGVAVSLVGCAGQAAAEIDLPAQDRARWVMPLDEFQSATMLDLPNYAENLLVADCLSQDGIEWPIPWQPTDEASYLEPPANLSTFPALTVDLALESGYRADFTPGWSGNSPESFDALNAIATSTPGFEPLQRSCLDEARKQVPTIELSEATNRVWALMYEAQVVADRAPAVVEADAAWQKCMKDAGYIAVPASPLSDDEWMPTEALLAELGIPNRWQEGDGAPENALIPQEIDLAVDDATCRESSGWSEEMYQAIWDAQADVVSAHADELVRIRDGWQVDRESILAIIAAHAPAH